MSLITLTPGVQADMLTAAEVRDTLAADRALANMLTGVRTVETFYSAQQTGSGVVFTTPSGFGPSAGHVWAVMNIGVEVSSNNGIRLYKQTWPGAGSTPAGAGRLVTVFPAQGTGVLVTNGQFAKGQLMIRQGDQLTILSANGVVTILSVFIVSIECPAERQGELLL